MLCIVTDFNVYGVGYENDFLSIMDLAPFSSVEFYESNEWTVECKDFCFGKA